MDKQIFINELNRIDAIQYGDFTLKDGSASNVYVELRTIVSYPTLLREITELLWEQVAHLKWDIVCGVNYTALPLATCLSFLYAKPMVLCLREKSRYGTKKQVEGVYHPGQSCLLIEDVVTTGKSVLKTASVLEASGLEVSHIISVLDREQGAKEILSVKGYKFSSILSLSDLQKETAPIGDISLFSTTQ